MAIHKSVQAALIKTALTRFMQTIDDTMDACEKHGETTAKSAKMLIASLAYCIGVVRGGIIGNERGFAELDRVVQEQINKGELFAAQELSKEEEKQ